MSLKYICDPKTIDCTSFRRLKNYIHCKLWSLEKRGRNILISIRYKTVNFWGQISIVCHKSKPWGFFSGTSTNKVYNFCCQKCGTFNVAILCILRVYRLDYICNLLSSISSSTELWHQIGIPLIEKYNKPE